MKKQIIISTIAILMATTSITAAACECSSRSGVHHKHPHSYGHHKTPGSSLAYLRLVIKSATALDLSDKQQTKIGKLLLEAETGAAAAHAKAEMTVANFRSKLYAGAVTIKDVKAYSKRMGELRAESLAARLLPSIKVKSILSAEQRNSLKRLHRRDSKRACSFGTQHSQKASAHSE
ncbi:MAG: Spy/CpxP family protein refolding chaperone [Mariprofundales bacterium]|nr:Spy/CpxP family protein refolding chaperone [Mariprofundales bacterium]